LFEGHWPSPPETFRPRDFKSLLQEATQRIWKSRPSYALGASRGPEHAKLYSVIVTLPDGTRLEWEERSMRKAEQGAAEQALRLLQERYPDMPESDAAQTPPRKSKKPE
jgi:ribonuclease-3